MATGADPHLHYSRDGGWHRYDTLTVTALGPAYESNIRKNYRILNVHPSDLSEQEKDELFHEVVCYDIDESKDLGKDSLKIFFKLAQEILKFKGEQVESLISEIDKLAARQGEDEVRHQSLLSEIETLQIRLLATQKYDSLSGGSVDELKQELLKAELKNEQLISELQTRERDLLHEKQEVEKFANQVMVLEKERGELRSELAALQRETVELQEARLQADSPKMSSGKYQNLVETIRHKNKHITQLLSDIETLEKENNLLKLKLAGLQREVAENSEQTTLLSEGNTNLKLVLKELQERCVTLEDQNEALKTQLMEMADDKQKRDDQLDQLGIALDTRLTQWQELLVQKDTELIELRQKLAQITAQFPNSYMETTRNQLANVTESLENREEQIEELRQQISIANGKISESQEVIRVLKAQLKERTDKQDESPRRKKLKSDLEEARARLELLEARVKDAETDADAKAEEMTEMVIQLREYETGVFGLPEAMEQIKELQKQKKVRDKHIEQLIQAGNQLQADANLLEEENLALRDQLGLDADTVIRVDGVLARYKADQLRLIQATQQLEVSNNNLLTLKVQNRKYKKIISKLKAQVKKVGFEPEVITGSSEEDSVQHPTPQVVVQGISEETKAMLIKEAEILENKLQDVIDENEALRKGMHEILDSVRSHDGTSAVHIESACLERLLEALDSRHLSGWYHPAMRLQAQLNVTEGNNAALREQLRAARFVNCG
ncbi:centrosomal protein of 290 kDa-like [Macrosteles quadrilineatus]|uniref:centrosomal protein of 290 kDa-like n=1 Tax=Macrosteles quadrilineatus TaxID=74068 RepID=UPI0023E268A6|nr:centrosomal protein of 290 kDa-like [Macrosteles quadrilineatus]